jgi:hypothetical protein
MTFPDSSSLKAAEHNTHTKTTITPAVLNSLSLFTSASVSRPAAARRSLNAAFSWGRWVLFKDTALLSSSLNQYQYIF